MGMEYARLGQGGPLVSRIAFGCEALGGYDYGDVNHQELHGAVGKALDLGINFFDTADVYGLGRSEEQLAMALGARRHDVVIGTKFGVNWKENPDGSRALTVRDASPRRVFEAVEGSLRRLRIESIPLYMIHWPDPDVPIADTMRALIQCQREGKIQHIGYSNADAATLVQAHRVGALSAVQVPYSIGRRMVEREIAPTCEKLGIGMVTYAALAHGLLTGKYDASTSFPMSDRRHRLPEFQGAELERYLRIIERLREVSGRYGKTMAQVALRWVLDYPSTTVVVVGARTDQQVLENVSALGWSLSATDRAFLSEPG